MLLHTVGMDTLNKGPNTFDFSIKDKFCGSYRTMAVQFYLLKMIKVPGPKVHYLEVSLYTGDWEWKWDKGH